MSQPARRKSRTSSPATEGQAAALLAAIRRGLVDFPHVRLVAAGYADAHRLDGALPPRLLVAAALAGGAHMCLLDTGIKDGTDLLDWLSPVALTRLVDEAHGAGLEVALAGGLTEEDVMLARGSAPTSSARAQRRAIARARVAGSIRRA